MKKTFYSEAAYLVGLVLLAFGTALMEKADFGMSMVVAPAYLFHLKLSQTFPVFSFGMAEYCLQLLILVGMMLAFRKLKAGYLFSFVTAVLYGLILDANIWIVHFVPADAFAVRMILFLAGIVICSVGVAMLFHTYFAPEAYELVVKEVTAKTGKPIAVVKTVYDITSLTVSVLLSFLFFGFGHFEGVKWGTLITALVNGWMIGKISGWLEQKWKFDDCMRFRHFFED